MDMWRNKAKLLCLKTGIQKEVGMGVATALEWEEGRRCKREERAVTPAGVGSAKD